MINRLASSLLLAGAIAVPPLIAEVPLPAKADLEETISSQVRDIFKQQARNVVQVVAEDRHGGIRGTGFFIDPAGTVLTLASTVLEASKIEVMWRGELFPAQLLMADPRSGLALLKVDQETGFIPAGNSRELELASPVVSIGYPMDMGISPSFGLVGGFNRKFHDKFLVTTHIRANLPVQAGFGGAPILNFDGEAVGVLIAGIDRGAACFALPIEAVEKIIDDYRRFGEARHGWVGVTVLGRPGEPVTIAELGPETPAAQSGLKAGDEVLKVGNIDVNEVEDILDASFFLTEGDDVKVTIRRGGEQVIVPVRSIRHPSNEKLDYAGTGLPTGLENRTP